MTISSAFQQSLLTVCLFSVGLAGCSKEKEKDKVEVADKATPVADKADKVVTTEPDKKEKKLPAIANSGALAYLPADCTVAIHADLKALAANPVVNTHVIPALREALAAAQKKDEDFAAFMKATGLDPFTDFHEFSVCTGEFSVGGGNPKSILAVSGAIDSGIVEILRNANGLNANEIVDIKGQEFIINDGAVFTQMNDGSLAGGNHKGLLVAAVDKPDTFADAFKALGNTALRIVVPGKTVKKAMNLPKSPFTHFAKKIDGATTVAVDIGNTTLTMKIATVDEASANEVAGMAKLLLSQVPKGGKGPESALLAALGAAKTSAEGKHFVMTMHLPAEQFEMASKMVAEAIRAKIPTGKK